MVVVVTVDENGGWWDHVAPPKGDRWGPGTRIPALVVSPFARKQITLQLLGKANNWVTRCVLPRGTSILACTTALAKSAARVKDNLVGINMLGSLGKPAVEKHGGGRDRR